MASLLLAWSLGWLLLTWWAFTLVLPLGRPQWTTGEEGWTPVTASDRSRTRWVEGSAFIGLHWAPLSDGLQLGDMRWRRWPNPLDISIKILRVDPSRWHLRVYAREDYGEADVEALAQEAGLSFAVNAAYFSEEGPLGLVLSGGKVRRKAAGHRAAHFLVDGGRPRVVNQKGASTRGAEEGFQGFPSIMTAGKTYSYLREGHQRFNVRTVERRTAGCLAWDGSLLLLVTDTVVNGLSLRELATVLGGLGCRDAMGFDGGTSTGLYIDGAVGVPNLKPVVVVLGGEPLPG